MGQISPKLLRFDRFVLDLTRGSLRVGDQEIALRPKAFDVLRHLADNAGRLVSKKELFEAVWPNVAVTDDSLVQCIRELRDKLGDTKHQLIRTVPRRGYLLNASATDPTGEPAYAARAERHEIAKLGSNEADRAPQQPRRRRPLAWAIPVAVACCALVGAPLAAHWLSLSSASDLFTEHDVQRIAAIAHEKELPLPRFQVSRIKHDVLPEHRRFVGIWVSSTGFINSNRQFMLVITNAERSGILTGFTVRGPPQALSLIQRPAGLSHFKARVLGDSFRYSGPESEREVVMNSAQRLEFSEAFASGAMARVVLDPIWTMVDAERKAALEASRR